MRAICFQDAAAGGSGRDQVSAAHAQNKELKIGFIGVLSGPSAAWGTSNVRSMEALAGMNNKAGGVKIGDDTYDIKIVSFDEQTDPKLAIQGVNALAEQGIHYIVGPNTDASAAAITPVVQRNNMLDFIIHLPEDPVRETQHQQYHGHGG